MFKTLVFITPISLISSLITGILGIADIAYILLAIGVSSIIGFLFLDTIMNYILPNEYEDEFSEMNRCEYSLMSGRQTYEPERGEIA